MNYNQNNMKRSLIFSLMVLLVWTLAPAQIQDTCRISSLDGMPDDIVNRIFKDHRGLMWFATDKGVTCYNGASIVNLEWEDRQFRRVVDVKEDAKGRIFAATNDGIYKVEMTDFVLKRVYPECTEISALQFSADGKLYACSNHGWKNRRMLTPCASFHLTLENFCILTRLSVLAGGSFLFWFI